MGVEPLGAAAGRGDCADGAKAGVDRGAATAGGATGGAATAASAVAPRLGSGGAAGSRVTAVTRLGAGSGASGAAGTASGTASAVAVFVGSLGLADAAAAGAEGGSGGLLATSSFGSVTVDGNAGTTAAGLAGTAPGTPRPLSVAAARCSSRDRRLPRRCESRGGCALLAAAGFSSVSADLAGASRRDSALAGASLAASCRCGLVLPDPPRRLREEPDSAVGAVLLPPSLDFAAVFSSTVSSVVAVPSAAGRPLLARSGMLRRPNTPGLTRKRSVAGRRASACSRDCIISSGSRPTTESSSYFSAKRVNSLK